jgi:hypothetical protein
MGTGDDAQRRKVRDTLEEKLGAIECESVNVGIQWNIIKECVLDTMRDVVGKADKKPRNLRITQEMVNKTDERRTQKTVNKRRNNEHLQNSEERNEKEPQMWLTKNILTAYVTIS